MQIIQMPCKNFDPDSGEKTAIIIHGTAGGTSAVGIGQFFINTEGGSDPVASHYIIDQNGIVVQCVQEKDGAWANGTALWNDKAISIEHVKSALDNSNELTTSQKNTSFMLIKDILSRHPKITSGDIHPHSFVYNTACPGPYPWNELRDFLKGGSTPKQATQAQRVQAVNEWVAYWQQKTIASPPTGSAIFESWLSFKIKGQNFGPPITWEYPNIDWKQKPIIQQDFAHASCEYDNGVSRWFDSRGEIV